jgi:SAM-dependent methyltransferase
MALSEDREVVLWHDIECGAYTADLAVWEEQAGRAESAILDLGCGTGRVAIHLAAMGFVVLGADLDPALTAELDRRALASGLAGIAAVTADVRTLDLGRRFGLILAPMQLIQLLSGAGERAACLRAIAAHLTPGGIAALAIVEDEPARGESEERPLLPDVREAPDGWIYSSQPLSVLADPEGIVIARLRQTVSPAGELTEELDETRLATLSAAALEAEAVAVGLCALERIEIPPSEDHVGSTVVVLGPEPERGG